jgi:hypothetical protein
MVSLETRPGVTQSFFIERMDETSPEAVALIYSGGYGAIGLRIEQGLPKFQTGNFLVRSRGEFIRNRVLPVIVDVPSDFPGGVPDRYRRSDEQTADARAVLAELRRRFSGVPVFVVTTSRSTLSGAHLGRVLGAREIAGVVLSSSMLASGGAWESLSGFDFGSIRSALLFVHHREDGCKATPYDAAERAARGFPLISVSGGLPPKSGPCDAFAPHGYYGKEARTIDAIASWMLKKPFAREID